MHEYVREIVFNLQFGNTILTENLKTEFAELADAIRLLLLSGSQKVFHLWQHIVGVIGSAAFGGFPTDGHQRLRRLLEPLFRLGTNYNFQIFSNFKFYFSSHRIPRMKHDGNSYLLQGFIILHGQFGFFSWNSTRPGGRRTTVSAPPASPAAGLEI